MKAKYPAVALTRATCAQVQHDARARGYHVIWQDSWDTGQQHVCVVIDGVEHVIESIAQYRALLPRQLPLF
jgi:hypothetical protein